MAMQNLLPKMKLYFPWLKDADSQALKYACRQVDTAYQNFFKRGNGFPKFHKKDGRQSYTTTNMSCVEFGKNKVKLPCLGWVKARGLRELPDDTKICMATISKETDGSYYASILRKWEIEDQIYKSDKAIALDYKSDGLYTDSNGNTADMPHWFRESQTKLARQQRRLSRKIGVKKGERKSGGWTKQQKRVARIYRHVRNQRVDYLHKLSRQLADIYGIVAVENLDMRAMSNKSFGNGKVTMDNGYGLFLMMLDYKLQESGGKLVKVDRWYPSSQICSRCGNRQKIPLSTRVYRCDCGLMIDRDYNAALNILNEALRIA